MKTQTTHQQAMELSDEQLRALNNCRYAGRNAAVLVLGASHHGLHDVESHVDKKLLKELSLGRLPCLKYSRVVAHHHALKVLKREQKQDSLDDLMVSVEAKEALLQSDNSPSQEVVAHELHQGMKLLAESLNQILKNLGPEREFLVGLVVRHNFNAKSFADELNVSRVSVTLQYHRLQKRLLTKLARSVEAPLAVEALHRILDWCKEPCRVIKGLLRVMFEESGPFSE